MTPTVSVVVPCLRIDRMARQAIESLRANDVAGSMEVLVVVDGPDPGTGPGADELAVDAVVYTGARRGSAAATNLGFGLARGRYLARMDADDLSVPGRLDDEIDLLERRPDVLAVGGGGHLVDEAGTVIGDYPACPDGDLRATLLSRNPIIHSSLIVRRDAVRDVGGYDETCVRMQDYELLLRLAQRGPVWGLGDRPLVGYRVHDNQTSRRAHGTARLLTRLAIERSRLAAALGEGGAVQGARNVIFATAQVVRYLGLRRPRYLRGTRLARPSGEDAGSSSKGRRASRRAESDASTVLFSTAFGPGISRNPYLDLLADGLPSDWVARSFSWRAALFGAYDVLHVHWPEYVVSGSSPIKRALKCLLFALLAVRLTLRRTAVVRTVHNLAPHGGVHGRVERALTGWLDRRTAVHVVMNDSAELDLPGPVRLIPHGHYRDTFSTPPKPTPVDGAIVCFGMFRRYKGVEPLLAAFAGLGDEHGERLLRLAGAPADASTAAAVTDLAAGSHRVELMLRRLSDEELEAVVDSAQLVVLPYRSLYNSGSVLYALSRGRPLLLPACRAVDDLRSEFGPLWIRTYEGELGPDDLADALEWSASEAPARATGPDMSGRDWRLIGAATAGAYGEALSRR